jgi:DUF1680 family protein
MKNTELQEAGFNRRDFIKGAVAGSVVLAAGIPEHAAGEEASGQGRPYAELRNLPPGAIRPEGWLRKHMEAQGSLTSALADISFPFLSGTFWEGEENSPAWYTWEQKAYWVDGATRLALVLGDDKLLAKGRASLDYTLAHASDSGFLGPKFFQYGEDYGAPNRWPNAVLSRGFMALADAQPSPPNVDPERIAQALRRHYLNDKVSYSGGMRNITNLEAMLWCFERTGDPRMLEMSRTAWDTYMKDAEAEYQAAMRETTSGSRSPMRFFSHTDLAPSRVYADVPIESHGVSYAEISKLPAILYLYTGNEEYRKFVVAAQKRIFDHHMLIDGIPSSSEAFAGTTALDQHETCDITDHCWSWTYVLQATADGQYGDRIERACFNAHPGATRNDWKGIQYFGSANQFLANLDCDHNSERWRGSRRLAYQPNPAQIIGCCGGNKHRFLPNYVMSMWMKTRDGGLAATLYGPSSVSAKLGSANQQVQVRQSTNYPFEEEIRFEITTDRPVMFPLALRIPGWCDSPRILLNGSAIPAERRSGFAVLRRSFKSGDVVTLTLPMKVKVTEWPENGVAVERGPLVYAMPIDAKWNSFPEAAYSSDEFPTWVANPSGEWNYGAELDPKKAASQVQVRHKAATGNLSNSIWPWEDAPVEVTIPARRLPGWDFDRNAKEPHQRFTPHLPDADKLEPAGAVERVTLVPFGATKLRMSIFPKLKS